MSPPTSEHELDHTINSNSIQDSTPITHIIESTTAHSPDLDSTEAVDTSLDLTRFHNITPPVTPLPPPTTMSPIPLRYPDTLGSVIEIKDSEAKGLGVFAIHDTPPGTILLCESPLVTLFWSSSDDWHANTNPSIDTGTRADPLDLAVKALSREKQDSFHSLHAFSRNKNESLNRSIVYSNGYSIMNDLATGVFETASRINHSCVPNSHYVWKEALGRMVFYNRFKLLSGEEVTVDYGHKRSYLQRIYGFECMCGGCTDGSVSEAGSESGRSDHNREEMARIDARISEGIDTMISEGMKAKFGTVG